ncbi:MAG: MobQ family relaxase [Legionellaceae bacterium]|nr:MobQ family relaxase [Legionellaceae bacterium]
MAMAIFYCQTSTMSRKAGHSAVAAAAYRAGEKLSDDRRGEVHDYRNKEGVIAAYMFNNAGLSREQLWNRAEASEVRKDARVAREWQLALPHELSASEHREILLQFSNNLIARYGVAIDVAIHGPGKEGDHRNTHAHLLMTSRSMGSDGQLSAQKTLLNWSDKKLKERGLPSGKQQIEDIRKDWANIVNTRLAKSGLSERIDHRSLKNQGVTDRIPTCHVGKDATAKIRRGKTSLAHQDFDATRSFNMAMISVNNRKKRLLKEASPVGKFAPRKDFKRVKYKNVKQEEQPWKPAPGNVKNILNFFEGREVGVFRWSKGKALGKVAFFENRKGIESYSSNCWALAAQLELAQEKVKSGEWSSIKLKGTDEFKRRAWLQAQAMGIHVEGYKPSRRAQKSLSASALASVLGKKLASSVSTSTPESTPKTTKTSKGMGM